MASQPTLTNPHSEPFKNAYRTKCQGCTSMLMLPLPHIHCPSCHYVWRAKKLSSPSRCPRCDFGLWKWRQQHGIPDNSNSAALLSVAIFIGLLLLR
jgi:hypothetical protein